VVSPVPRDRGVRGRQEVVLSAVGLCWAVGPLDGAVGRLRVGLVLCVVVCAELAVEGVLVGVSYTCSLVTGVAWHWEAFLVVY